MFKYDLFRENKQANKQGFAEAFVLTILSLRFKPLK